MFVIYHVQRCYDQGLRDGEFEILSITPTECGAQFAGDIEHGLAARFGYTKYEHYARAMEKRSNGGRIGGKKGFLSQISRGTHASLTGKTPWFDPEVQRRGGLAAIAARKARGDDLGKSFRSGEAGKRGQATQLARGIHISQKIKGNPPVCPHCGRVGKSAGIYYHIKACGRKHSEHSNPS